MGADIVKLQIDMPDLEGDAWRVTCADHPELQRIVFTEKHATNIAQLHDRVDHADEQQGGSISFDISAAARAVVETSQRGYALAEGGALDVWIALTGCSADGDVALDLAREYADHPTTAHTAPF